VFEEVFWEIFVHTELPYFEPCRISSFKLGLLVWKLPTAELNEGQNLLVEKSFLQI